MFTIIRPIALGLISYVPPLYQRLFHNVGGGDSARYCYSVWLRHLVCARNNGLLKNVPKVVAELGPGDTIGSGLAALLCGCERYYGLDAVHLASFPSSPRLLGELVDLLRQRADIPGDEEFVDIAPKLPSYAFPHDLLTDEVLTSALRADRIDHIQRSIENMQAPESLITYAAPWTNAGIVQNGVVDLIFSQAVMEHITDLPMTYQVMKQWLRAGDVVSHQIDFRCHGTAADWNGHWTYSDGLWNLMMGKRWVKLNRDPISTHVRLLHDNGFTEIHIQRKHSQSHFRAEQFHTNYRQLAQEDLTTSDGLVQAMKPVL